MRNCRELVAFVDRWGLRSAVVIGALPGERAERDADRLCLSAIQPSRAIRAAGCTSDGRQDVVFVDGPTEYALVRDLLRAWYPKARPGGLIGGAGYLDGVWNGVVYGIKTAVDELAANHGLQVRVTFDRPPAWFVFKRVEPRVLPSVLIAMLTAYDANQRDLAAWSSPNKRRYCRHHGYEFIELTDGFDPSRPPSWSKVRFVKEHLPHFDWLFWTDADSLIMNNLMRLEQFIEDGCDLVLTHDDFGVGKYVISMGQFLIRNCDWSMRFLDEVWEQKQFLHDRMWEQAAVQHLLTQRDLSDHVCVVTQRRFNSYLHNYRKGDFLLHFAMQPPEAKSQLMQVWHQFSVL